MMMDLGAVFRETIMSTLAGRHANVRKKKKSPARFNPQDPHPNRHLHKFF